MLRKIFDMIKLTPYRKAYLAILLFEILKAVLSTFLEPFGLQMVDRLAGKPIHLDISD